eukprot:766691-Hanusia_phi.AAC.3
MVKLALTDWSDDLYMNVALHFSSADARRGNAARETIVDQFKRPALIQADGEVSTDSQSSFGSAKEQQEGCWYLQRSFAPVVRTGSSMFEYKVRGSGTVNLPRLSQDVFLRIDAGGKAQQVRVETAVSQARSPCLPRLRSHHLYAGDVAALARTAGLVRPGLLRHALVPGAPRRSSFLLTHPPASAKLRCSRRLPEPDM